MKRTSLFIGLGILLVVLAFVSACGGKAPSAVPGASGSPVPEPATPEDAIPDGAPQVALPAGIVTLQNDAGATRVVDLASFTLHSTEVTNALYSRCVDAGVCLPIQPVAGAPAALASDPAYAEFPALGVDYNMAAAYCQWVGGRLPTEAEWVYAASAGDARTFPWGEAEADCEKANFLGCLDPAAPIAVGSLPAGASPFGLMDMAGNAWEWVYDWYAADVSVGEALTGPISGEMKVVRGGGYDSDLHMLTNTQRLAGDPYTAYSNVGFRCVLEPALDVPASQQEPAARLHTVPLEPTPVDGVDPSDPAGTPALTLLLQEMGCPDEHGKLHFNASLTSTEAVNAISFSLNGAEYTCDPFDPVTGWVNCYGHVPAEDGSGFYHGNLCSALPAGEERCVDVTLPKPADCAGNTTPLSFTATAGCGADGVVPLTLNFSPEITWYDIFGWPAPDCSYAGPGEITCLIPDITYDQQYLLGLHGTYNGAGYFWGPVLFLDASCADEVPAGEVFIDSWPVCQDGPQMLIRHFIPGSIPVEVVPLGAVTLNGQALECAQVPGDIASECALDPALAGQALLASICVGDTCDESILTVPDCSRESVEYGVQSEFLCLEGSSAMRFTYLPAAPAEVTSITADGAPLECVFDPGTQSYTCTGFPEGVSGGLVNIKITYADGTFELLSGYNGTCQQEGGNQVQHWFYCNPEDRAAGYTFTTMIVPQQAVTSINLNGVALSSCYALQSGSITCSGIPGDPGASAAFEICYADGHCIPYETEFPDCPPDCNCALYGSVCYNPSMRLSFSICDNRQVDAVLESVYAEDGLTTFSDCEQAPFSDEKLFHCYGIRPNIIGQQLTVHYQVPGDPGVYTCSWPREVWQSLLPPCEDTQFTPTPELGSPPVSCSAYKLPTTCENAGCYWIKPASGGFGHCSSTP